MSHWKLGIYGHPEDEKLEDNMEYYFVVLDGSEQIESVIQRAVGKAPAKMAGKKFVKADGVRLTFYYRLKEVDSYVTLTQVMSYGQ